MLRGSLTGYIDVAQMTLYAFFIFFFGVVFYLRKEDKREGYPLEADNVRRGRSRKEGFPAMPRPKVFRLFHGGTVQAPNYRRDPMPQNVRPMEAWPGSPLHPTGNPMADGVGPAAFAQREDVPEAMIDGSPMIVPMRLARETSVDREDVDPRGMPVLGADGLQGGVVSEIWVDLAEPQIRYLQVAVEGGARQVLLPMAFARIGRTTRRVKVKSILARHFAGVPATASLNQVTKLEEDKITAYFGAGHLYAKPSRLGPWL